MTIKGRRSLWIASAMVGLCVGISFAGCSGEEAATTSIPDAGGQDDDATAPDAGHSTCGNKVIERGEDCDDGNKTNGDGCENDCAFTCTKGTVNGDPRCDDHEPCDGTETCTDTHTCVKGPPLTALGACGNGKICRSGVCSDSVCGDGVVTAPEECDDGNSTAGDGCESNCKFTCTAGDPAKACPSSNPCVGAGACGAEHTCAAGAAATDGTTCPGAGMICKAGACVASRCGDGIVTAPETCDDGNQTNGDGCDTDCQPSCADPAVDCAAAAPCNVTTCNAAHTCESGADASKNGTTCGTNLVCKNGACVAPSAVCGNGTIEAGEDCDFGNSNGAGSGCELNCRFSCTGTSCDDANPCNGAETCNAITVGGHTGKTCGHGSPLADGVACGQGNICLASACKQSTCGDGFVDPTRGDQCEPPGVGTCDASCHLIVCGNGVREQGEQCDDGNLTNLDGCDGACKLEQSHRVDQLKMQFGTDTYCSLNALGGAIGGSAQGQLQTPLDEGVKNGSISVLFKFIGGDLNGTSGPVTLGSVAGGAIDVDAGAYDGTNDLDWWYTVDPTSIDGARNPTTTLTGSFTAKTLNAAGRFSLSIVLSGSAAKLDLWNATLRSAIGATSLPKVSSGGTPGHLATEHLDPALQTFASSGVGANGVAAGQLCGNVTTGSLAGVAVPTVLLSGLTKCTENYSATNSLLDVYIGGCHVLGGFVTVISKTQPDQVDPTAPQAGAGGPYKLSASSGLTVDTCRDKNNTVVPLAICHAAMAYSASFKFATDRVILK